MGDRRGLVFFLLKYLEVALTIDELEGIEQIWNQHMINTSPLRIFNVYSTWRGRVADPVSGTASADGIFIESLVLGPGSVGPSALSEILPLASGSP